MHPWPKEAPPAPISTPFTATTNFAYVAPSYKNIGKFPNNGSRG